MNNQQQMLLLQRQRMEQQQRQAQQQQQQGIAMQMQQQRLLQQQQVVTTGGQAILRLMLLCDELSVSGLDLGTNSAHWHMVIDKHFAPEGRLVHELTAADGSKKAYEVLRPTIALYFQTYFESGAVAIRVHPSLSREHTMNGRHHVSFASATFTVLYPNGARLEMSGSLNFLFAPGGEMVDCMEIKTVQSEDLVGRSTIEDLLKSWSPAIDNKASPKMTKKPPKAQQRAQSALDGLTIEHFPKTPKGFMGGPKRVQHFLEVSGSQILPQSQYGVADGSE
jgi:hypothetical protein